MAERDNDRGGRAGASHDADAEANRPRAEGRAVSWGNAAGRTGKRRGEVSEYPRVLVGGRDSLKAVPYTVHASA